MMYGPRVRPNFAGLCLCACHQRVYADDDIPPIPKSEVHDWCGPCADHRFTPWTEQLDSMLR